MRWFYLRSRRLLLLLLLLGLVVLAFCACPFIGCFGSVTTGATSDNWGLSFQTPGSPPVGNADQEFLKSYNSYYLGNTQEKVIYLTFDAGFENGNTAKILEVLKKQQVPAAFFLVGSYIKTQPELVKNMVADGHIVGNHTMTHPDMAKIGDLESFKQELEGTEKIYQDLIGKPMPKLYRPPQGKFNEQNLKFAQELGYTTVFWSLAYVDWYENKQPTHDEAFKKLLPRIHNGAIVLLHSTSKTNAEILDELLTKWKEMGFVFKAVTELGK